MMTPFTTLENVRFLQFAADRPAASILDHDEIRFTGAAAVSEETSRELLLK